MVPVLYPCNPGVAVVQSTGNSRRRGATHGYQTCNPRVTDLQFMGDEPNDRLKTKKKKQIHHNNYTQISNPGEAICVATVGRITGGNEDESAAGDNGDRDDMMKMVKAVE
ncbi:hypothetical protein ACA910_019851 [Epithemia clementina (nom. ined.)]